MYLLAANSTLRTILVLLIMWLVLRMWSRARQGAAAQRPRWAPPDQRSKGEVRIERVDEAGQHRPPTQVEDADFEEIK